MLKFVVTLAVITYASALYPPGLGKCSWGPSHWCSRIHIAKQCEAVDYCIATVWANQKLVQDSNNTCEFCKNIIKDVKNFIDNKQTQDQIIQYMNSACAVLPTPDLVQMCENMVKNDWAEFMKMVDADLDPQVICASCGLCSGLEDQVKHAPIRKPQVPKFAGGDICKDCEAFFGDIKSLISNPTTEKELEDLINERLCSLMGDQKATCEMLVKAYLPELIQLLQGEVDPVLICKSMQFCSAEIKLKMLLNRQQKPRVSADICGDCKTFFADIRQLLNSSTTEQELEAVLENEVCPQMGQYADMCKVLVKTYLPEIISMLTTEDNPSQICAAMGFCKAAMPQEKLMKTIVNKANKMRQFAPKKAQVKASTECVVCEFVMKELDSILSENSTETEIIAALDKVCSILPKDISKECQDFVNTYGPTVILLLRSELTPSEVCSVMGLCSKNTLKLIQSGEECTVCKVAIQYIDSLLSSKPTQQEIEKALDKVCNFLPDTMKSECQQIVDQYTPELIQLLLTEGTPEQVCEAIKACPANQAKPLRVRELIPEERIVAKKAQLVGVNECTWGPAYWCGSKENAVKCNAVEHCEKHVWN